MPSEDTFPKLACISRYLSRFVLLITLSVVGAPSGQRPHQELSLPHMEPGASSRAEQVLRKPHSFVDDPKGPVDKDRPSSWLCFGTLSNLFFCLPELSHVLIYLFHCRYLWEGEIIQQCLHLHSQINVGGLDLTLHCTKHHSKNYFFCFS